MELIHTNNRMACIKSSSPIYGTPYELLAEIMVLTLTPRMGRGIQTFRFGGGYHDYEILPSVTDVLVLCQICSFWRQVALDTPRLWIIDSEPFPLSKGKMPALLTEMFLKRSTPLPISVRMEMKHYLGEKRDLIISASHRWKHLQMAYDPGDLQATGLQHIPRGNLNNLETLYWYKPEGVELDMFLSAPRLRNVTIRVPHISSDIPLIPWGQLTRLELFHYSPQPCLDIIVHCKNLVSAHVGTKQWFESDSPDTSPVGPSGFLANLEELKIEMEIRSTGEHLGPFLRRLQLPALKSLSLSLRVSPGVEDYFISWLTPSLTSSLAQSPTVKSLALNDCVSAEDIADILRSTPNLTHLVLDKSEVDDDFFAVLQNAEHNPVLAPKLEQLVLWDAGEYYAEESLIDMIRSRWWSDDELCAMPAPPRATRLKCVSIWNEHTPLYLAPEWKAKVDGYRSQGLRFNESKRF